MKKYTLSALAAAGLLAGGLSATSASAADLGGNCCADLEERIAELEATTARKGNRKVSLTISGWVAEQVMWWDDGVESNTYVGGIGTTLGTNVKFTGQATIAPGWSAGYVLHLEADGSDTLAGIEPETATRPGPLHRARPTTCRRCSRSGSSRASTSARSASVCSRWLRTTPPSSSTARARSFRPTGWRSTYGGFVSRPARRLGGTQLAACGCMRLRGLQRRSSELGALRLRRRSPASRCRRLGVRMISGMSAVRYAGEFSGFKLAAAAAYSEVYRQQRRHRSRRLPAASTSRLALTSSTYRRASSSTAPTATSTV